jgi:hypothetical protein
MQAIRQLRPRRRKGKRRAKRGMPIRFRRGADRIMLSCSTRTAELALREIVADRSAPTPAAVRPA